EEIPPVPRGRIPAGLTAKQRMARKLRTKRGREKYARRKAIIEPIFGQVKQVLGFRQFSLRGLAAMRSEWRVVWGGAGLPVVVGGGGGDGGGGGADMGGRRPGGGRRRPRRAGWVSSRPSIGRKSSGTEFRTMFAKRR